MHRMANRSRAYQSLVRNIVFGTEDSLVSTVGFLAGIASADVPRGTLFLSGFILIVVEALSMGIGSLLAETTVEELQSAKTDGRIGITGGVIMFVSYFLSGFIPLLPYLLLNGIQAFVASISASLAALFALGWLGAGIGKGSKPRAAFRMLILGGIAIAAGILVGRALKP